jgi:hypothetical protein
MRILFIGDVVGKPGRQAVRQWVPGLMQELAVDIVVANGENTAGGIGATRETLDELRECGVSAFTMGNHVWRKKEMIRQLDDMHDVVRPANYPEGVPGSGGILVEVPGRPPLGLVNALGRVFMDPLDCPFKAARREVDRLRAETPLVLVDIHAEATSEKVVFGHYLDGDVSAVVGTHTHIPTADERILPGGTAYITDVGMTGPVNSAIGVNVAPVLHKFLTGMPAPFNVAKEPPVLSGVLIEADESTGRATSIQRVRRE